MTLGAHLIMIVVSLPSIKGSVAIVKAFLLFLTFLQCCNSQEFVCCDEAVRLSGGNLSNEGRVEMCMSGQWKTICDNNWSENEARVVCRQLGHANQGTVVPLLRAAYGQGTGTIVEHISCSGIEIRLTDCSIRDVLDGECTHSEDASVQCPCRIGDLRLEGSNIQGSGRVEICINNVWGSICDNSWSSNDARVVCKQLGFSIIGARHDSHFTPAQGSSPIHMDNVRCTGMEPSLIDCPHSRSHSCSHRDDAAVQCRTRIICYDGDVRLANGSQPHEGRVEVCFNETWGTVCDYISPWNWYNSEADVVCQQLGFSGAKKSTFGFGRGRLPALISYVYCRGYESNLGECTYSSTGLSDCDRYGRDIIGVQCMSQTIKNGEVRLTNGLHKYAGRVEIYWSREWRTVCNHGWDEFDAQVVCRQLNYLSTSVQVQATHYKENYFKTKRNSMLLTNSGCSNSENNLISCCADENLHSLYCPSRTHAGVRCSQCVENSTRLYGELSQREGFVLMCLGGFWGKIAFINTAAAKVVCRQLGFSAENTTVLRYLYRYYSLYGSQDRLPYILESVECTSHEVHLSQCNHTKVMDIDYFLLWSIIECQLARETVCGEPQSVQISNTTSSTITLTWSPPLVSERHGLSIFGYIINCSTDHSSLGNSIQHTDILNATLFALHSFTSYNCCVAANSSRGRGRLACLRAVTLPSGVPTRLNTALINSMSVLLSWHAPDAHEFSNGVLRQYYVEITDNSSTQMSLYLSDNSHLLLDSLQPGHQYTFRVAAYTNEKGPFSQPISATLPSLQVMEDSKTSDIQHQDHSPLMLTASFLGLASFLLLIVVAVAGIYISYKLCKQRNKKVTRPAAQVPINEMVDMRPQLDSGIDKSGDANVDQLTLKQEQAKDFSCLPHEYLTPAITKFDQSAGPRLKNQAVADEENTYQPLIPPPLTALSTDKSEYQSLTQKTLPTKFSASSAPPTIPSKPNLKAASTIT